MDPSRTRDPSLDVVEVADIIGISEMLLRSRLARGADSYVGIESRRASAALDERHLHAGRGRCAHRGRLAG